MHSAASPLLWIVFFAVVLGMLAIDLGVTHRKAHVVHWREAAAWSAVWVVLSLGFAAGVWAVLGPTAGLHFITGYLVEKALSVDNVFVFVVLFASLAIPPIYQHRVLFWGILGALLLRGLFVVLGAALIARFHWLLYVFGAVLLFTGIRLLRTRADPPEPPGMLVLRLLGRWVPTTTRLHGEHFFAIENGRRVATPLFVALVAVEATDIVFAIDSVPAIFAITTDPFLVFTSNVFAILGLRAMYFLLAGVIDKLCYLKTALAGILVFVGSKMLLGDVVKVPAAVSLAVIAAMLTAGVVGSLVTDRTRRRPARAT